MDVTMSDNRTLAKLLEYHLADDSRREKIVHQIPKPLAKLLETEEVESSTLIQEEVYRVVLEGAEPAVCMRDAIPVIRTKTNALRYVMGSAGTYADEVSEGAEIPIKTDSYSKADFTIKKIGTRPLITRELIDDGLFDVATLELKKAGKRIENKLNRDAINELISNASGSQGYYNASAVGVSDVAQAIGTMKSANRTPDTLIMTPGFEAMLLRDSNLVYVNRAGTSETLRRGIVGSIFGLKVYSLSVTTANGSWDGSNQSGIGAVLLDSTVAGAIAVKRDISVERYDDPIRDLEGISVTMRYGVKSLDGAGIVNFWRLDA
jgi:HK97 family phage major capsid protein